jgi:hypothetical protein
MMSKKPIQLKRKAVVKAEKKTKSFPNKVVSVGSPCSPASAALSMGKVSNVKPGM